MMLPFFTFHFIFLVILLVILLGDSFSHQRLKILNTILAIGIQDTLLIDASFQVFLNLFADRDVFHCNFFYNFNKLLSLPETFLLKAKSVAQASSICAQGIYLKRIKTGL